MAGMAGGNRLTERDLELLRRAAEVIKRNYDGLNHTVGAAVRCKSGAVYAGVNVFSVHGACAEVIAMGSAIGAGNGNLNVWLPLAATSLT